MPAVPGDGDAGLRAVNARLRGLLADRGVRIAGQDAEIADLATRVGSNSRNSSQPPSSDGLAKPAPKSLRGKCGRKPGRPKGQPGAAMQLSGHRTRRCGTGLRGAAAAGSP
jgi:transposase